jgi:alkylated DNA repair dioxygenase AlkB
MNNLFNDKIINILDTDGTVNYYGKIITQTEANRYLDLLLKNIPWKSDEALVYGKHITTKRKVAWYGDLEYPYTYSNTTKRALPWTRELLDLRKKIK